MYLRVTFVFFYEEVKKYFKIGHTTFFISIFSLNNIQKENEKKTLPTAPPSILTPNKPKFIPIQICFCIYTYRIKSTFVKTENDA